MGLFNKLFGRAKQPQSQAPTAAEIIELGNEISKAWGACGKAIRPHIFGDDDLERTFNYFIVLQEFFYFFVHVTDRSAQTILGQVGRDKLMKELTPYVIHVIENVFAKGFAANFSLAMQKEIKHGITEGLEEKRSYYAYGELKQPTPEEAPDTFWLFEPLIIGITLHSGRQSPDSQFTKAIVKTTEDTLIQLDLEKRLNALKYVLA